MLPAHCPLQRWVYLLGPRAAKDKAPVLEEETSS